MDGQSGVNKTQTKIWNWGNLELTGRWFRLIVFDIGSRGVILQYPRISFLIQLCEESSPPTPSVCLSRSHDASRGAVESKSTRAVRVADWLTRMNLSIQADLIFRILTYQRQFQKAVRQGASLLSRNKGSGSVGQHRDPGSGRCLFSFPPPPERQVEMSRDGRARALIPVNCLPVQCK